jgi:hypothetical protein
MKNVPQRLRRVLSISALIFSTLLTFTACKKQPPPPPPAKGSLVYEGALCYPYTVHGTYYNGVPGADSNYVEINVDVTSPGSYQITTDKQNGVTFSASGVFTDTGLNVVHLKSSGAFLDHTFADFNTSFDSTHCQFRVWIADSAGLSIADNAWQFTAGGHLYQGTGFAISTLYPGGDDSFIFYGSMPGSSDTSLIVSYLISVYDPGACSHPTSGYSSFHFNTSRFATGPMVRFDANNGTAPAVIDVYNCSSNVYYFNGTARDSANNIVPITNARFKAVNVTQLYFP